MEKKFKEKFILHFSKKFSLIFEWPLYTIWISEIDLKCSHEYFS